MIDSFTYPQGDVQTWDETVGEEVETAIPKHLKSFLSETNKEFHIARWVPSASQLMDEQAMMLVGFKPFDERMLNPENRIVFRIRDKISGCTFRPKEPLEFDFENLTSEDEELISAALARICLVGKDPKKIARSVTNKDSWHIMVNFPIKEYEANSLYQIRKIMSEIRQLLSKDRRVKRLWLRGQQKEYRFSRSQKALEKLPFGKIGNDFPSLVPSLGRFALKNLGKVNFSYAFLGPNHWWKKPFLIWVIRQNPEWIKNNPSLVKKLNSALTDESDIKFTKLLADIRTDPTIPDEIDDLRQWFFAYYKYSSWIWVLQQYGYLASMLDITWDIDTALFFSQAQMIDNKFGLPEPNDERIIYVFAENHQSQAFKDVINVDWGDSDWARELPLRVKRQKAGCLIGSTWFRQNYYGHLVIAKIHLGRSCITRRKIEDVFPSAEEDLLLKTLLDSQPAPQGLYY